MTPGDVVLVQIEEGVALVRWNRPDRHNSWNLELENEYFRTLDDLDEDDRVRAVVVTGTGTSFCPGMDMSVLRARTTGDTSAYSGQVRRPLTYPLTFRKPLIAAINGGCSGIGLLQALLCDVRFIADEAKIAAASTTRGLPAEFGLAWLLERLSGHAVATDLLLSGRPIQGQEAVRLRLASESFPRDAVVEHAVAYGRRLAAECSPAAMAVVKQQMLAGWSQSRADAEAEATRLAGLLQGTADFTEGIQSFIERRGPAFAPLPSRIDDAITPSVDGRFHAHLPV